MFVKIKRNMCVIPQKENKRHRLSRPTVNKKRISDVLSGGRDSNSCVQHPHSTVNPEENSLSPPPEGRKGMRKGDVDPDTRRYIV